jgi:hypothetical protein
MRLSKHFTLAELTATNKPFDNVPTPEALYKLQALARWTLDPIRVRWGALRVNSGYRSPEVNKACGGAATSAHLYGCAADVVPVEASLDEVYTWIAASTVPFDQLIHEGSWLHIGIAKPGMLPNRRQAWRV